MVGQGTEGSVYRRRRRSGYQDCRSAQHLIITNAGIIHSTPLTVELDSVYRRRRRRRSRYR
jgi:hypothetical protein